MLRKHDDGAGKRILTHRKHFAIMPYGGIRCAGKPVPSHVKARSTSGRGFVTLRNGLFRIMEKPVP